MFGNLFGGKKKIVVIMIDADTNVEVDRQHIPATELPETFADEGKMEGKGKEWIVVDVTPKHAHEYLKTGTVTMKVSEVKYVNPKDILMTLPTISNELPKVGTVPFSKDSYFNMHEDDWRQIEFLSRGQLIAVEKELDNIRLIYEKHSVPINNSSISAFNHLHVRTLIPDPIIFSENSPRLEELKELFGSAPGSLTFSTSSGKPYGFVENGFSFNCGDEVVFYGNLANGNSIASLGVRNHEEAKMLCETLKEKYDLLLVDWVNTEFH
jgi:hypothetical protein